LEILHLSEIKDIAICAASHSIIIQHRDIAMRRMVKQNGNGYDTLLWYDNWVSNQPLLTLLGLHNPPIPSEVWKVVDILEDGVWCLKLPELQQVWSDKVNVKPGRGSDTWIWTDTNSKTCTLKSAWAAVRVMDTNWCGSLQHPKKCLPTPLELCKTSF